MEVKRGKSSGRFTTNVAAESIARSLRAVSNHYSVNAESPGMGCDACSALGTSS